MPNAARPRAQRDAATVETVAGRLDAKLERELGPVVAGRLVDPATEDVLLNPDGLLWWKGSGSGYRNVGMLSATQAHAAICTVAAMQKTVINHEHSILETQLPGNGSRFSALVPPVVRAPVFAIRVRARKVYTLDDYCAQGVLGSGVGPGGHATAAPAFVGGMAHIQVLRRAILARRNILVVGGTATGKTTFLNAMLAELKVLCPDDRLITIEDTAELQCSLDNYVDLHSIDSGEHQVSMLECLKASLRLRPSRIVVGEVRGGEAHSVLKAWNTGHPGGLASLHANDAVSGLSRLEALIAEAPGLPGAPQQRLIAEAVNLVVFIDRADTPAGRRVREVVQVDRWNDEQKKYEVTYL